MKMERPPESTAGWDEQQHGEVVGDAPVDTPRLLHLPDAVEGHLHVVDQVEHRPEQHDEAHADEDAVLRLRQVGVDDVHDGAARLVQATEAGGYLVFYHVVEAEPAGDGKNHGQDGDEGKQGAVGQGGGLVGQSVLGEAVDAEVDGLDDGVDGEGGFVHLVFGDAPDVIGEEFPKSCDSLVHGGGRSIHYIYKKSSRPVSRVLFPALQGAGCLPFILSACRQAALAVYPPTLSEQLSLRRFT